MKEVILEFLRNMKDEEYAKNIAYAIAVTACAIGVIVFMLKGLWKHGLLPFLFAQNLQVLI